MRKFVGTWILLIASVLISSPGARAQTITKENGQSATANPQTPKEIPDLTGVWDTQNPQGFQPATATFPGEMPSLTPWGQAQLEATRPAYGPRAVPDSTDPVNPTKLGARGCFPPGVPRIYLHPLLMEIIEVPGAFSCALSSITFCAKSGWMGAATPPICPLPTWAIPSASGTAIRSSWIRPGSTTRRGSTAWVIATVRTCT